MSVRLFLFAMFLSLAGCETQPGSLFTRLDPDDSGVLFENSVKESEEINILNYEYAYNGGGVAAADFNNDGLCDLFFTGNMVSNRFYLNRGGLRFSDVTKQAGVEGRMLWKTGVTAADVNGDGWLDLYVCYSGPEDKQPLSNQLFINNQCEKGGIPTFTERAKEYKLDADSTYSTQAAFFDYDRDGDLDMFLINHGSHFYSPFINTNKLRNTRHPRFGNRLYRNEIIARESGGMRAGNFFTEVSQEAGIHGGGINFGLGVSISDLNSDGWPDIFVTNDYEEQDFLYMNNGDGTFTDATKDSFGHLSRNGMGTDIADFNNDGRPDLVEADMWPEDNYRQKLLRGPDDFNRYTLMVDSGFHHQQMRNTLQMNAGTTPEGLPLFCEIGQMAGVSATDWSWAPLFLDADNDGFKDLFISNGYLRDFTSMDFLKFTVEEARRKSRAEGAEMKLYDLVTRMASTKTADYIFRNNGDLTFSDHTGRWGMDVPNLSFGTTLADLDNDGDLELITNHTNAVASIWVNHSRALLENHYLQIRLHGPSHNFLGIGARVLLETGNAIQLQEQFLTRGFQSSVDPRLHFGLGPDREVERVRVIWPDGKESQVMNVSANQMLDIHYTSAIDAGGKEQAKPDHLFEDLSGKSKSLFVHRENAFNDFDREPLLPYQLSKSGPALASGDVNGDGFDDVYLGGASGQSGALLLGDGSGGFAPAPLQPWQEDSLSEDTGAIFFDPDNDGDLDLFVISGGNEFPEGSPDLDDRLYLNQGRGRFTKMTAGVIADHANGSCAAAADFDKDGDTDLYVGGRVRPGNFPVAAPGAILRNESGGKNGVRFSLATRQVSSGLREPGMVTDAMWTDYNNDTWPDLLIVGHFMPVRLFENRKGNLVEVMDSTLSSSNGLWNRICAVDYDRDGDMDYALGNAGRNLPWRVSASAPLTLYHGDFNADGRIDPVMSYTADGQNFPVASRDELLGQMTSLRKKFTTYASYAAATMEDILEPTALAEAQQLSVRQVDTSVLENLGDGTFALHSLPVPAQMSSVNGALAGDFDRDGNMDILLAGNFYPYRTAYGRSDAGVGLLLLGDGKGDFRPLPWDRSGFFAPGDVRNISRVNGKRGRKFIIIARNDDAASLFELVNPDHENL